MRLRRCKNHKFSHTLLFIYRKNSIFALANSETDDEVLKGMKRILIAFTLACGAIGDDAAVPKEIPRLIFANQMKWTI